MNLNLTTIKKEIVPITIVSVIIVLLLGIVIVQQLLKSRPSSSTTDIIPSTKQEPVIAGKFDTQAQISQKSKTAINNLKSHLPYRTEITTTTGSKIIFALYSQPENPYALYVETLNINFLLPSSDPNYPQTVQDFRDTATAVFTFMKQYSVNPADVFISWGSKKYIQDNAQLWLVVSDKLPNVIKKDNQFIFGNSSK